MQECGITTNRSEITQYFTHGEIIALQKYLANTEVSDELTRDISRLFDQKTYRAMDPGLQWHNRQNYRLLHHEQLSHAVQTLPGLLAPGAGLGTGASACGPTSDGTYGLSHTDSGARNDARGRGLPDDIVKTTCFKAKTERAMFLSCNEAILHGERLAFAIQEVKDLR